MVTSYSLPAEVEWSFYGSPQFKRQKVLIVGVRCAASDFLRSNLNEAGFQVITAETGSTALVCARAAMPSLIVLDAELLAASAFDVCRRLKRDTFTRHIPIIIQKTGPTEEERIQGFEFGADDFVAKPYNPYEMVLRIKNSLARAENDLPTQVKMAHGELVLDPVRHVVTVHNQPVRITVIEFRLLLVFMERCGRLLKRETLLQEVWQQPGTAVTRTVDTHIRRLRGRLGTWARHLESIRGVGYRLNDEITPYKAENKRREVKTFNPSYRKRFDKNGVGFTAEKPGLNRSVTHRSNSNLLFGVGTK